MSKTANKFSPEVRERAVRMVDEHRAYYVLEWAVMTLIAGKIGCAAETLRRSCREQVPRFSGLACTPVLRLRSLQNGTTTFIWNFARRCALNSRREPDRWATDDGLRKFAI